MRRRDFLGLVVLGLWAARWRASQAQTERVEAFLSQMTLRQKVGQLFLFSLPGTQMTDAMRRMVAEGHAGGLVLFGYNIDTPANLTALTNDLQRAALANGTPVPLFIAADQEGGRVSRLQGVPFSPFPNPMALGAADDLRLSEQLGAAIAQEMRACGLNINLAPVLDVNSQQQNPVINVRAFGSDPARVAEHGAAFIRGSQAAGVIATGKHFPGHGSTLQDSHYALPVVSLNAQTLRAEMTPFQAGIAADVGAMMTAHVLYSALDNTPATFSAPIMTDLLRTEFGFEGVLLSDALTMGAVSQARDNPVYVLRDALLAGVDLLAYGALPDGGAPSAALQWEQYELVVRLVESGLLPESRIDEAARRVLRLKARFNLLDWSPLSVDDTPARLRNQDHTPLIDNIARAAVTQFSDSASLLPLAADTPDVTLLYPAEVPQVARVLQTAWPSLRAVGYPVGNAGAVVTGSGPIICCTLDVYRYPAQGDLLRALPPERSIVVALRSPYDILAAPRIQTYVMTYGTSEAALVALRDVLSGAYPAPGRAPVTLF